MNDVPEFWRKPRPIHVVVDNPSWVLPYGEELVKRLNENGDEARLCRQHDEIGDGAVAFYFGCVRITPPEVLARNRRNLVVHASDLPQGRGFSPLTWQVLEGKNDITICLLDAVDDVDSGNIVYRDVMAFEGHELNGEMRRVMGAKHVEMALRFLAEERPPAGEPQQGEPTLYCRRKPDDSRLDPERSIADQFDLLRTVDNERYPAYIEWRGHRYNILIEKADPEEDE